MNMDITKNYLGTPFEDPKNYQYIHIPINFIPQEVINKYSLMEIVKYVYMCIKCCKPIYGLVKSGAFTNKQLQNSLRHMDTPNAF